ncbi:MAG: nuclear transport factor 2 family protein [Spirochaetales bacterium]|nr:nuclear transport factor 2 family protein [Spirochaetales bacterium]
MSHSPGKLFERLITAFHSLDLEEVLSCFTEDATLYDPHYPVAQMTGKA